MRYDPDIERALVAMVSAYGRPLPIPRGDWQTLRASTNAMMELQRSKASGFSDITRETHDLEVESATIKLRWYAKPGAPTAGAVLYIHGGGMICGDIEQYDSIVAQYVAASGVPMLAVDYRLAPEFPHPTPLRDCFAALRWLFAAAAGLGVDPARIAVMGDSAGGGIAAGTAQLARDAGIRLRHQILIYAMLDDRNTIADPALDALAVWSADNNATGWTALLGTLPGAALWSPARVERFDSLAPAYIEVGALDIFHAENLNYAQRLLAAHVPVEMHVHPGAPHAFERIAPEAAVSQRAIADRVRVLRSL